MSSLKIYFRYYKQNIYSYSSLSVLFPNFEFTEEPKEGIMIYSFFTNQKKIVYEEIINFKEKNNHNKIFFISGGPHPTGSPKEVLEYFDFVIIGEGEKSLPELINYISNKKSKHEILDEELIKIKGIGFKDKNKNIIITKNDSYIDLNSFPCFNNRGPYRPIEITRGCLYSCKYCQTPQIFGHKLRHRSIDQIVKYSKYFNDIRFISPNSFSYGSKGKHTNEKKIELLLRELNNKYSQKNIFFGTFPSEVRPDYVKESILDMIHKYCKNKSINIGAQSGSNKILNEISRGHNVEDVFQSIQSCFDSQITPIVDFIFGFPNETINDIEETMNLINWICKNNGKVRAHYFMPLPGTKYEHKNPTMIPKSILRKLGKMAQNGDINGKWTC